MFYSKDILSRKNGKLGIIWLAGTTSEDSSGRVGKVTKKEVMNVDIEAAWYVNFY